MTTWTAKPKRLRVRLYEEDRVTPRQGVDVYFTVQPPRGRLVTIASASITNPSTGVYSYLYPPTTSGRHTFRAYETIDGIVVLTASSTFTVPA